MKKILIFSTAYLPLVGGAELAIKEITERLPDISFTLITARLRRGLPRHERLGSVEVYRVGHGCPCDKWFLPFRAFRQAKKLERQEKFDVIWSMMASQASVAAARFKKKFPDKKLVLTLQEGDEEEHLKRYVFGSDFLYRLFIRPWHMLVFKRADAITAISNYLAARARRNLYHRQAGNPRVPVTVIPNGVDVERFKAKSEKRKTEELKQRLGIKPDDKIVITTSRLVEKNDIGVLIAAMRFLPENVKLLICGSGPLLKNLQLTTYNLQLTNRVRFLGYIPHEHLPSYLHASDIFCRPSCSEGMGSSFIEAMAAGLPVVATPVGGITDFLISPSPLSRGGVEGGVYSFSNSHELENSWMWKITGLFCKVGDPRDITEKIRLLLDNQELRERIIANAFNMVKEKYDWRGISQKMRKVFIDRSF